MEIGDVHLTDTTRSKEFRYYDAEDIERIVRERDGGLYYLKRTDGNRFHLVTRENIVLVLQREGQDILVISQQAKHGRVYPIEGTIPVDDYLIDGED